MQYPEEAIGFMGYFEIPGFSDYAVTKTGDVINKHTKVVLSGGRNPDGYFNFGLIDDNGKRYTWGRHRLMAFVFKHPGVCTNDLVVNHINAIKGDDRLENLEWVTYQGNAEHAGALGLTEKCLPISVRNTDTGEVVKFSSIVECAREYGLSKDAVNYRVRVGETRVFPERKQYRPTHSDNPWFSPENIEDALMVNGTTKSILLRDVLTGSVIEYTKLGLLAKRLNVSPSTVTAWTKLLDQPVLPGFFQIKWSHDRSPWREIVDPQIELDRFTNRRSVVVTNDITKEERIFSSTFECSCEMGLNPTALNYRLKSDGRTVFSDGHRYRYYSGSIQKS